MPSASSDIDSRASAAGRAYQKQQLDELRWLGLTGTDRRSSSPVRTAHHEEALRRLADHVYECFCSRAEIAAASAPHGDEVRAIRAPARA